MIYHKDKALKIAEFLLQIKAVKLQPKSPFTWASGWKSPIYCDNRLTMTYPVIRELIAQAFVQTINTYYPHTAVIAGTATAGIPQGVLVAQELGIPFIYVRSSPKEHGMGNIIEGYFEKGQRVVVIEDLISTGGSSLKAIQSLREAGLDIKGLVAIFTYGFEIATKNFAEADCPVLTLSDYDTLVESALKTKYITEDDIVSLHKWREKPESWNP